MNNDKFNISESEQRRLIIDLLIRITVENSEMRATLFAVLSQGNPQKLQAMMKDFQDRYVAASQRLKETIFANYGDIDLDDLLSGGAAPKTT